MKNHDVDHDENLLKTPVNAPRSPSLLLAWVQGPRQPLRGRHLLPSQHHSGTRGTPGPAPCGAGHAKGAKDLGSWETLDIPSGYVKIAIENGH